MHIFSLKDILRLEHYYLIQEQKLLLMFEKICRMTLELNLLCVILLPLTSL